MKKEFSNIRAFVAKLIGNPDVSAAQFAELDSAILSDEASMEALLASSDNVSLTASEGSSGIVVIPGTPAEPTAFVNVPAVVDVPVATASAKVDGGMVAKLDKVLQEFADFKQQNATLAAANVSLTTENQELRAVASPMGVVSLGENVSGLAPVRVDRTADKDAAKLAELTYLKEKYPESMKEFILPVTV